MKELQRRLFKAEDTQDKITPLDITKEDILRHMDKRFYQLTALMVVGFAAFVVLVKYL